jgi:hypothetical protein
MSKRAIVLILAIYLAVAMFCAVIKILATPEIADWRWGAIIGSFVGTVVAFLFLPGLVPLIYWAFRRFRADYAGAPIILWGYVGTLFVILLFAGAASDGSIRFALIPQNLGDFFSDARRISQAASSISSKSGKDYDDARRIGQAASSSSSKSGKDYDDFIGDFRLSCVQSQRQSQLDRGLNITDQQISSYCKCMVEEMSGEITADEIVYFTKTNKPPESIKNKIDRAAELCFVLRR